MKIYHSEINTKKNGSPTFENQSTPMSVKNQDNEKNEQKELVASYSNKNFNGITGSQRGQIGSNIDVIIISAFLKVMDLFLKGMKKWF